MGRRTRILVLTAVLAVGLAGSTGCHRGTPTTCKGWVKYLKSPVKAKDAIRNLGELHCKESLPELEGIFANTQYKDEVLQAVKNINAPEESVALLKLALENPEAAVQAAVVAEDFGSAALRDPLVQILTSDKAMNARMNALKALAKIDSADLSKDEALLIQILREDPNVQGIEVNAEAARILGEMKSEKAVPDLVVGLFLRTQRGQQMYTAARKALAQIGKPAVEPLIAVLEGDRDKAGALIDDLEKTAKKLGFFEWQTQDGPEIVQVLGDLRDTRAAMPIAKNLGKPLNPPVGVDDRVTRSWKIAQQNRITMAMMALWNVGTPEIVPTMVQVITNQDNDAKQRLDTASALSILPGFVGVKPLLDVFSKTSLVTFRAPLVTPLSLGMDWANKDAFMSMLNRDKDKLVQERFKGEGPEALAFQAMIQPLEKCAPDQVDCLVGFLKGDNVISAEKAAILMGGLKGDPAKTALTALLETYPTIDPQRAVDLRRFVLLAIWRLGDKSTAKDLERLMKADNERKGARYWVDEIATMAPAF